MASPKQPTHCPCGTPLTEKQRKAGGKYCCSAHKGEYHRDPPKDKNFGLIVPKDKSGQHIRVGKGLLAYIAGPLKRTML